MKRFVREAVVFASIVAIFHSGRMFGENNAWWIWLPLFFIADVLILNATINWRTSGKDVTDGRSD